MHSHELISTLKKNQPEFIPAVPFDPGKNKLLLLDFSTTNNELTHDILNDTRAFCDYINRRLEKEKALYGIGGYDEHRIVYTGSKIFDNDLPSPLNKRWTVNDKESRNVAEPRRLHLGIDIWGRHGTAVIAPLNGIVHSFAFNDNPGDYGATIILSHQLEGISFYTLYGHLSLNSIKNIREGDRITKADIFAEFGIPAENGQWPPHLHFQIINDLEGWSGDYPGVCKYSEREKYLANCPDPDLVLQMMKYI